MADAARAGRAPIGFAVIACYLIVDCLWRLATPGGPWPVSPWPQISMTLDAVLLVALVWLWTYQPAPAADSPPYVRYNGLLFGVGAAAGVVMLILRFTSEHGWWTGHLRNGGF